MGDTIKELREAAVCAGLEREFNEFLSVIELLAAPLQIDGPNHAADVKRARELLTPNALISGDRRESAGWPS